MQQDLFKKIRGDIPLAEVEAFYRIDRKSGKNASVKVTHRANDALKLIHSNLLDLFYKHGLHKKGNYPFAFGWVSGTIDPIKQALLYHKREDTGFFPQYWFVTDIKDAYESVDIKQLAVNLNIALGADYQSEEIYELLHRFCEGRFGGLARGFSTSPLLFNIYAHQTIDTLLFLTARKFGIKFCRLGDDLIFSSKNPIGRRKRKELLSIVRSAGFTISVKKTRYINLKVQKTFKIFNVMVRNTLLGATILPSKTTERKMRGMLFVERNTQMDLIDKEDLRNKIHGWNGFCKIPEGITRKRYEKIIEGYKNLRGKAKEERYFLKQGQW